MRNHERANYRILSRFLSETNRNGGRAYFGSAKFEIAIERLTDEFENCKMYRISQRANEEIPYVIDFAVNRKQSIIIPISYKDRSGFTSQAFNVATNGKLTENPTIRAKTDTALFNVAQLIRSNLISSENIIKHTDTFQPLPSHSDGGRIFSRKKTVTLPIIEKDGTLFVNYRGKWRKVYTAKKKGNEVYICYKAEKVEARMNFNMTLDVEMYENELAEQVENPEPPETRKKPNKIMRQKELLNKLSELADMCSGTDCYDLAKEILAEYKVLTKQDENSKIKG